MQQSKASFIIQIVMLLGSVLLAVGVKFVFYACTSMGEDASCLQVQDTIFYIGIVMAIESVIMFVLRKQTITILLSGVTAILAVLCIVIPDNVIALCTEADMRCRTVMSPAVEVICVILAVISVANVMLNRKTEGM